MSRFSARATTSTENTHTAFKENRHKLGVLITNLGTPDAPTPKALRRYLAEFLSDPRVVEIPRILWLCILHGIILRIRPKKSAKLYESIWTDDGSPLLSISLKQQYKLQQQLGESCLVKLGMRYGSYSIAEALRDFQQQGITRIVALPLYPQYGGPTTGATFDAIADELKKWRFVPEFHFINHYYRNPSYIQALCNSITEHLDPNNLPDKLVLSYHGMPKQFLKNGDPYYCHSLATTQQVKVALMKILPFEEEQIISTFQSRFGKAEWLQPYTDVTLAQLAKDGAKKVAIACPAFSVDCLETLEEIAEENKDIFIEAGGAEFQYIPALNDRDDHIGAMQDLIKPYIN